MALKLSGDARKSAEQAARALGFASSIVDEMEEFCTVTHDGDGTALVLIAQSAHGANGRMVARPRPYLPADAVREYARRCEPGAVREHELGRAKPPAAGPGARGRSPGGEQATHRAVADYIDGDGDGDDGGFVADVARELEGGRTRGRR